MEFRFIDPASDFSNGIDVLYAYHESLLEHGALLLELTSQIHERGITETTANQVIDLHSYYTRANSLHHQDEEKALFPIIVNRNFLIDGMIERLALDHEEIENAWGEVTMKLRAPENIGSSWLLLEKCREFERLQREHLVRENEDFLPSVKQLLSFSEQMEIGGIMANIRGLDARQALCCHGC